VNPLLAQWLPVIVMLSAIWTGLLYNNKRLDDFKDLLRAEVGKSKAELQTELERSNAELRAEIAKSRTELHAEMAKSRTELHVEIETLKTDALRSEQRILQAIAELKADLKTDIQALDRRLQRLEAPVLRTS